MDAPRAATATETLPVVATKDEVATVSADATDCNGEPIDQNQRERKRRRLSRKEQKARKKMKKKQVQRRKHAHVHSSHHQPPTNVTPQVPKEPNKKETSIIAAGGSTTTTTIPLPPANYQPIPIPDASSSTTNLSSSSSASTLGKWFPKAKVIKSSVSYSNDVYKKNGHDDDDDNNNKRACLLLFYQYVSPPWSESKVSQLLTYLTDVAHTRRTLGGRIRVAPEGVNATVSSVGVTNDSDDNGMMTTAEQTLQYFCQDLRNFDTAAFHETDFKFVTNQPVDRHFKDLKLLPVRELVFYGIRDADEQAPLNKGGQHLEPSEFHQMLEKKSNNNDDGDDDVVVVDVRNHYEAAIGRFDGGGSSAQYIDPKMRKSTDYTTWLAKPETQRQLKGKTVLMYCTGGVRCERASAYLNTQMGSEVKGVYQLKGGIERYLQQFPDGGYWRGKNYVFDKREAISADNREGDGGVVRKSCGKKNATNDVVDTHCCLCTKPWDRYIGKKHCHMCGVPVLVCDTCLSNKLALESATMRCPLCVEEDITVPADELQYTKNGMAVCGEAKEGSLKKAAPSVLKWGGGTSKKKRQKKIRGIMHKPCRFGSKCVRKDCFFYHPNRTGKETDERILGLL